MSLLRRPSVRLFILICAFLTFAWSMGFSWQLPESWKDSDMMSSSRARIAKALGSKNAKVDEIYGLLHIATAESDEVQHVLANQVQLDPTKVVDLDVYAAGDKRFDWQAEMKKINEEYPVVVFSKSYCPYSRKAKSLLVEYGLTPAPKVIEVDLRDDASFIKALLTRLTHHSTFPNILVRGKSLGGSDDLQALHATKALVEILQNAGVSIDNKDLQ